MSCIGLDKCLKRSFQGFLCPYRMKRGVKIERGIQSWIRKYEIPNSEYRLNDETKETKTYQHYIPILLLFESLTEEDGENVIFTKYKIVDTSIV